ncbi:hypothetical protein K1T71_009820 [Dendrolimus kikuchii]|uniref:Uncharacterized protein n=1 Tax=Dendrolimus kikuchii TaxID=765133 RepID=A0ACC1CTU9_9NEOP|nr:hypothetical protein K1T71_009820 [Dendrolimus kikuchii]
MAEGKGRGRGLALMQALKKAQMMDVPSSSENPSPEDTPAPSVAPSVASSYGGSTTSTIGGRGRVAAMLLNKIHQKPGASDVSPSCSAAASMKGVGRGKLLLSLQAKASLASGSQGDSKDVQGITQRMAESTISQVTTTSQATSVAKNKYFKLPWEHFRAMIFYDFKCRMKPDESQYLKEKVFDGTTMYVPHQLPDEALNLVSVNPFDNSNVNISIIFRRTRRLSEMIHIYNVLFKSIMKDLQLVRFGRQHFNEHAAIQIPQHKLEVWPGYVTAVDEYEGGLMLTLDSTHRVLRTQTVLSLIKETVQREGANWKKTLTEILVGCSVMTTYNKKLFRVDTIDDKMTPKSTFEKTENGKVISISYIDYYKKNYGIEIMDWNQPMLISRESKRMSGMEAKTDFMICLVPELCQLTGLTDDQRTNFRLMKDVATYTRITPSQRHSAFKKYIENVMHNETAKNRLAGWGLSIAPETINLTARTLPPETIFFGNNVKVAGKPNAEWNNEVTRNSVMQAVDILRWVILFTDKDRNVTRDFLDTLKRSCKPMGINVVEPEMVKLPNDRNDSYLMALKKVITSSVQLVVCICPTSRDDRYAAIKKVCCADNPVPSQVINARTIMNQNKIRAITQKILLQMNCKLGGTLWNISIPFKTAMIVGVDSYHDPTRKKRSVVAFVSSYNPTMTHWYSKAVFQERGQEIVDSLKSCLVDALKHFLSCNGRFPDRIIIYRDGVGDGQLKILRDYEIPQFKICFSHLDMTYEPSITYIVVQKRINTRIFMKAGRDFDNPPPGTVLDNSILRRDWYDFLVVSQKVNQGTVTPTHYVVVHDDSKMTPDQCQRITYKMCHLYYNWPGTVRVPAPCQYAHKLAYLVGQNIHQEPSDRLSDKLYFL